MTTTITLHVNGRYVAKVKQDELDWVEVHGNYEGSPNPDGKRTFNLRHNTSNKFVVNEEYLEEKKPEAEASESGPGDATAQGAVIEVGTAKD